MKSGDLPAVLADDLDLIADMTNDFARSRDIEETLRLGLGRIAARMGAEAASLFLIDEESGDLVCRACTGPSDVSGLRLKPGQGIVWRTVECNVPQLVCDTRTDPDFAPHVDHSTGFITRTVLCAPLSVRDERLGAIELFNKAGGGNFDAADRLILQALGASAALALISARHAAAMVEQEAFRRELAVAADIQRAMLPAPQPAAFPIHGINLPARGVSGDFFDIVELADGKVAFAIADVAGKGVNAALLAAKTASLFRCLCKRLAGPAEVLRAIDAELAETGSGGLFVTMVAGVLDRTRSRVVLANAGHEPPVWERDGTICRIEGGAPPLGIVPDLVAVACVETRVDLAGGRLILMTDGLTEARRGDGTMLGSDGAERLLLERGGDLPMSHRLGLLQEDIDTAGLELRDDVTVLVVADEGPLSPGWRRVFPADPARLGDIRRAIASGMRDLGAQNLADDAVLAVDEACQNIIRHAYRGQDGDIVVSLDRSGDTIEITLADFAVSVDPVNVRPRRLNRIRPGGLGTHFIQAVMDQVDFLPPPPGVGNILRMRKRIEGP